MILSSILSNISGNARTELTLYLSLKVSIRSFLALLVSSIVLQ